MHWLDDGLRGDLQNLEHLHAVRVIGKRLRYAMEVFADCFAPAFRDRFYPQIEEMQEVLGNVNDAHVACHRLEGLGQRVQISVPADWKRLRPGFEALVNFHKGRLPAECERFQQWMSRWRQPDGEASFFALLKDVCGDSPSALALRQDSPPVLGDDWVGRPACAAGVGGRTLLARDSGIVHLREVFPDFGVTLLFGLRGFWFGGWRRRRWGIAGARVFDLR